MTIRILESGAALARHSDGWQRLADRAGQPFLSSDYLLSAIEAFHLRDTLRIVVLESGGDLVAAAPLVLVRRNLHWALELIGTPRLMDPTGFLHDSPASLRELVAAVSALGYPIHLRGVAADGETLEALRRGLRQEGGMVVTHDPRVSAAVLIRGDWANYQATLTPKMRQDLRRFQSRAQAIGRPEFAWSAPSSGDAEGLVRAFLALEASGWKAREPGALARAAPLRAFYAALITRAAARGTLRVATLHLDEAPAAMLWAVEAYNRLSAAEDGLSGPRGAHLAWGAVDAFRVAHRPRSAARRGRVPGRRRAMAAALAAGGALLHLRPRRAAHGPRADRVGPERSVQRPAGTCSICHAFGAHDRLRHAARHELRLPAALRGRPTNAFGLHVGRSFSSASRRLWRAARQRFTLHYCRSAVVVAGLAASSPGAFSQV